MNCVSLFTLVLFTIFSKNKLLKEGVKLKVNHRKEAKGLETKFNHI